MLRKCNNSKTVLRTATSENEEDRQLTISELHQKYKLEAINSRLQRLACKVWQNLSITNETLVNESREENDDVTSQDHYWWRRISPYIEGGEPQPEYNAH